MYYRHIPRIISLPINKTLTNCQNRPKPPTTAYNRHQSSPITTNHHLPSTHSKCRYCILSNAAILDNIRHTNPPALVLLILVESLFNCRRYSIGTSQSSLSLLLLSFIVECFLLLHCLIEEHSRYEAYHDVDSTQAYHLLVQGQRKLLLHYQMRSLLRHSADSLQPQ